MISPTAVIIEDTKDIAELYRHILTMVGFDCELIPTGMLAEKRLKEVVPDLIILDLRLEDDRVASELLSRLQGDERFERTVVFIATGHPRLAEPLQDAADLVLQKPIDIRFLTQMAIKLVSKKLSPDEDSGSVVSFNLIDRQSFTERLAANLEELKNVPQHLFLLFLIKVQLVEVEADAESDQSLQKEIRIAVQNRLLTHTRLGDALTTWDQDEFGVILYNVRQFGDAWSIADRLTHILKKPGLLQNREVELRISIGGAGSSPDTEAESMLRMASNALLEARKFEGDKMIIKASGER
jgi:PleD family two-component response regulator